MKKQFFVMALLCLSVSTFVSCSTDDDTQEIIQQETYQTKSTTSTDIGIGGTNPGNGDDDKDKDKDTGGIKIPNPKK